jgi:hypothetical protein
MQAEQDHPAIPFEIRLLLTLAGSLLPLDQRSEWRREWLSEFWHSFRASCAVSDRSSFRRKMLLLALGAFQDAWTLVSQDCGFPGRIRSALQGRAAIVVLLSFLLFSLASVTNGFNDARVILSGADTANLVVIAQPVPFMGLNAHIPAAQADYWLTQGSSAASMGKWLVEDRVIHGRRLRVMEADATALSLLFESPVRPQFDRVGPLPAGTTHVGVIARLRAGRSASDAQQELATTAKLRKGWLSPSVTSLVSIRRAPLLPIGALLLVLMIVSGLPFHPRAVAAGAWALAETGLCFATIGSAWLELAAHVPVSDTGRIPMPWGLAIYIAPLLAAGGSTWWLRHRGRNRCRICYRRLSMPVSVGRPGNCLMDPSGVEFLCGEGHGAWIVGPAARPNGEHVWVSWSKSWA